MSEPTQGSVLRPAGKKFTGAESESQLPKVCRLENIVCSCLTSAASHGFHLSEVEIHIPLRAFFIAMVSSARTASAVASLKLYFQNWLVFRT